MNKAVLAIIVNLSKDKKISQPVGKCISFDIDNAEYVKYALENNYLRLSTPIENIDTATLKNVKLALKESGLKQAGEKEEIRKRLKEQGNIEIINKLFTNTTYKLTEKGKNLLIEKNYAIIYIEHEFDFFYPYISLSSLQDKIEKENKDFITACKELYTKAKKRNDIPKEFLEKQELKFYEIYKQNISEIEKIPVEKIEEHSYLDSLSTKEKIILEEKIEKVKENLSDNIGIKNEREKKLSILTKIKHFFSFN